MQAAPPISDAHSWLPSRATSRASSYHTVLDNVTTSNTGAIESVDSLVSTSGPNNGSDDASSSSPPTTPGIEYETIQHTRHGKALVIEHPTLVNFVPTSEIQTAVSVTADRVVIDTIFPPTAVWRASNPVDRPLGSVQQQQSSEQNDGERLKELLKQHEEQLRQTLKEKLTDNYDPTGTIKEDIFTTLTQVTRFPDPVGTDLKKYTKDQCPCICCEVGCTRPLEPYGEIQKAESSAASTIPAAQVDSQTLQSTSTQPLESFLDMTETSTRTRNGSYGSMKGNNGGKNKHRFGFLTFGRFGRSRSDVDLSRDPTADASSASGIPSAAPALPSEVTGSVVSHTRSRSFTDLVRRRRSKHLSSASMSEVASSTSQPIDTDSPPTTPRVDTVPDIAAQRRARHSLDSFRVDTPLSAPTPPPRRSSKVYAIVHRKPIPAQFSSNSRGSIPAASKSMHSIGQIVEEDEPMPDRSVNIAGIGAGRGELYKRHSELVSDYGASAAAWSNVPVDRVGRSATQRPETADNDTSQIGLAL